MVLVIAGIALGYGINLLTIQLPGQSADRMTDLPAKSQVRTTNDDQKINVRIIGDGVNESGEYKMHPDSEVIDLIKRANGLKTGAVTDGIKWNASLYDGLEVTVPTHQTFKDIRDGKKTLTGSDLIRFRRYDSNQNDTEYININHAKPRELQELPGIGKVLSKRIIRYRKDNGPFSEKSDLKHILGIGDVTFQELRSKIEIH